MIDMAIACAAQFFGTLLTGATQLLWTFLGPIATAISPIFVPILQTLCPWVFSINWSGLAFSTTLYAVVGRFCKPFNDWLLENIVNPSIEFFKPCTDFISESCHELGKSLRNGLYWFLDIEIPNDAAQQAPEAPNVENEDLGNAAKSRLSEEELAAIVVRIVPDVVPRIVHHVVAALEGTYRLREQPRSLQFTRDTIDATRFNESTEGAFRHGKCLRRQSIDF